MYRSRRWHNDNYLLYAEILAQFRAIERAIAKGLEESDGSDGARPRCRILVLEHRHKFPEWSFFSEAEGQEHPR